MSVRIRVPRYMCVSADVFFGACMYYKERKSFNLTNTGQYMVLNRRNKPKKIFLNAYEYVNAYVWGKVVV